MPPQSGFAADFDCTQRGLSPTQNTSASPSPVSSAIRIAGDTPSSELPRGCHPERSEGSAVASRYFPLPVIRPEAGLTILKELL